MKNEDIEAVKKYYPNIDDDTFMYLISLDPTYRNNNSLGKYGKWILNLYNKGAISEDDYSEITPLLNQFTTYRNRIQNKDLNAYKSLADLESILAQVVDDDSMLTDRQKLRFLKNVKSGKIKTNAEDDYETVYEDSDWVVWVPNTHEASMKLGKGTEWCTAHENPEWYETYTQDEGEEFSLYIMKNKHTGERYQYCDNYYRDTPFMDQDDVDVDDHVFMDDLYESGDEEFIQFLIELNPVKFNIPTSVDGMLISREQNYVVGIDGWIEPDLVVPDGVVRIDECAFEGADELVSITFPSTLKEIYTYAFKECDSLDNVNFEKVQALDMIGPAAFMKCSSLQYLYIGSVSKIHESAFYGCDYLRSVTIDYVEYVGKDAFALCSDLISISLGADSSSPLIIEDGAFRLCHSLETVTLSDDVMSISETAFDGLDLDALTICSNSEYVENYCNEHGINYDTY